MRESKYRAWNKAHKKMIYPEKDMLLPNLGFLIVHGIGCCFDPNLIYMLYTNIKDKNKKDIYDGDILKIWFGWCPANNPFYNHKKNLNNEYHCYPVEFHQGIVGPCRGSNVMEWRLGECHNLWNGPDVEIIGNIYENPELIRVNNGFK